MVLAAGIDVPPDHDVHHKNRVKSDNRLENLEVLPHWQHKKVHLEEDPWL